MSYATIVCDPPWTMPKSGGYRWRKDAPSGRARFATRYATMSLEAIRALGVGQLAAADAYLWLWVPTRHLEHAPGVCRAWGFDPVSTLVWSKPPFGWNPGPREVGTTAEFFLLARRGRPEPLKRIEQQVFEWGRPLYANTGGTRDGHSTKPEQFYELVEETTPGPRVELFARRGRLGWDAAGDEALATVQVAGIAS